MGEEIRYVFTATGQDSVAAAFESVQSAAERSAKSTEGTYARTARAASGAGRTQKSEAEKAAAAGEKAAEKTAKASEKAAERAAKAEQKAQEKRWKEVEKASAKIERELEKEAKAAERAAARKAKAEEDAARRSRAAWTRGAKFALGLAAAGVGFHGVKSLVGKAGDVIGEAKATQGAANRISINGGRAVDPKILRREFEATAIAHAGQTGEGVASGVAAFQEARGGNRGKALEEARKYSDVITTVASATGKGADEIGKAAALIAKTQGVKTVDEMGNALAVLVAHARESGRPLEEAISHLDKMGATAKRFGLTGPAGAAQMGALQVLGAEGAGAGQGDKVAEAFLRKITSDKTARTLKGAGVDPYADKNGTLKTPREILEGLYGKVGTSASASDKLSTINKMAGPQGAKMLDPLNKAFAAGYAGANGSDKDKVKAGVDAMLAAFDKAAAETGSYADMQKDAAQAESQAGAQMEAAWQKIVAAAGEHLVPELANLATEVLKNKGAMDGLVLSVRVLGVLLEGVGKALGILFKLGGEGSDAWGDAKEKVRRSYLSEDEQVALGNQDREAAERKKREDEHTAAYGETFALVDGKWQPSGGAKPPPPVGQPAGEPAAGGPGGPAQGQPITMAPVEVSAGKLATAADKLTSAADALRSGAGGSVFGAAHSVVDPS